MSAPSGPAIQPCNAQPVRQGQPPIQPRGIHLTDLGHIGGVDVEQPAMFAVLQGAVIEDDIGHRSTHTIIRRGSARRSQRQRMNRAASAPLMTR